MVNDMKKDFLVVILIVTIVMGTGYMVHNKDVAYSSGTATEAEPKKEVIKPLDGIEKINNTKVLTNFIEEPKKEEDYTLEEVYSSILHENEERDPIPIELINIYNNFYKYFDGSVIFKNKYNEQYTYQEYLFIKEGYNILDKNFGLYIISNTKCNVYYDIYKDDRYC